MDGAHNDEGITALVHELNQRYQDRKINIVFAALLDKSLEKMIDKLDGIADRITFVSFDYPRAASANILYEISTSRHKSASENWQAVIEEEINKLGDEGILVITGSLYFISEVKHFLLNK
jgi:dihydrofolate synthase/folylpolyglutamate synthase